MLTFLLPIGLKLKLIAKVWVEYNTQDNNSNNKLCR